MRLVDILTLSVKNLRLQGRKARLSVLAVAVSIFSFCLISGLGDAAAEGVITRVRETGVGGVTIYPEDGSRRIGERELAEIDRVPHVTAVTPLLYERGSMTVHEAREDVLLIGVNEQIGRVFRMELLHGSFIDIQQVRGGEDAALVDDSLSRALYGRENIVGKTLSVSVGGLRRRFTVCGVIHSQKNGLESMMGVSVPAFVYVPYTTLNMLTGQSKCDRIAAAFDHGIDSDRAAAETARKLSQLNDTKYSYENLGAYVDGLWDAVELVRTFVKTVSAISMAVGGIGIMNCMLYAVDARRSELGICMALGEGRRSILLRFITEAVILCLTGGLIGAGATFAVITAVNRALHVTIAIPLRAYLQSGALSFGCGIFFGLAPAFKASRLDPIHAMTR